MTKTVFHVVFTPWGAENLRYALRNAGRDDRVVAFSDDLRFGPIDSGDSSLRLKWIKNELGLTGWGDVAAESDWFWQEALSSDHRMVAWLSRRSAREYAGFLEWLWRQGDGPCEIVDLTDLKPSRRSGSESSTAPVVNLAELVSDEICDNDLFDQAKTLLATTREKYQTLWRRLRAENAALRILKGDALVSAPISFFDSLLISHVTGNWRKVAMIVSETLASQMDDSISDLFLASRVDALVESGRLERQGRSAVDMRHCEVRLPEERQTRLASQGSGNPT